MEDWVESGPSADKLGITQFAVVGATLGNTGTTMVHDVPWAGAPRAGNRIGATTHRTNIAFNDVARNAILTDPVFMVKLLCAWSGSCSRPAALTLLGHITYLSTMCGRQIRTHATLGEIYLQL